MAVYLQRLDSISSISYFASVSEKPCSVGMTETEMAFFTLHTILSTYLLSNIMEVKAHSCMETDRPTYNSEMTHPFLSDFGWGMQLLFSKLRIKTCVFRGWEDPRRGNPVFTIAKVKLKEKLHIKRGNFQKSSFTSKLHKSRCSRVLQQRAWWGRFKDRLYSWKELGLNWTLEEEKIK